MEFIPFGAADKIKLTVSIIQTAVCIPTKSGKVCSTRDAVRFMMLCQAQRLNPFAGDCFLCGYDGKNGPVFSLITAHQSFLKRAETCEDYEGMESGIILVAENGIVTEREGDFKLPDEQCVGGWARVFRKGRKPTYRRLSIAAMKPNYDTPFWNEDKAPGQICKCAEADALRATFPTLLGGLYMGDELRMQETITGVVTAADAPKTTSAKALFTPPALEIPPAAEPQPESESPENPTDTEPPPETAREMVTRVLAEYNVPFDDLRDYITNQNIAKGADSWASLDDAPDSIFDVLAQPAKLTKILKTFGKK